ncbi:hypothetical protein AC629_08390 [Bradyrhizobium sp. NAS80.1]|uniref:hypothetical protein n=1 Tax=Bradyrhizobium sp. NAS80.1 TaxID=1680159 RepID=UPI00095AB962|nr:hypothetical protein [Bradyrhizobium sp. NAS80.1]OKO88752.1 hypothetical protein AC629_08390 [Bradyrhizobium sp. NAS80.1]
MKRPEEPHQDNEEPTTKPSRSAEIRQVIEDEVKDLQEIIKRLSESSIEVRGGVDGRIRGPDRSTTAIAGSVL